MIGLGLVVSGLSFFIIDFGTVNGDGGGDSNTNPIGGEQKYSVDGSIVIAGELNEGAVVKRSTFEYDTSESLFSLSFIEPDSSNLALTGAENIDVSIGLYKDGDLIDRYTENVDKISAGNEKTINFQLSKVPEGEYGLSTELNYECATVSVSCDNKDKIWTTVEVPKGESPEVR